MFTGELKDFQKEAFDMMQEERSLLLSAVMGAGKTVITIAVLEDLIERGEVEHGFIICLASLKYQWGDMLAKFADDASVVVIDGSKAKREKLYRRYKRMGEYCIMNYEQVVNDWAIVSKLPYDFVVCDEVQAIKNFKAKRSKAVKRLAAPYRFGLTGQPVENRAEEVFSIMDWVEPGHLGNYRTFDTTFIKRNRFGGVEEYVNMHALHKRLSEKMFRRSYDDIKHMLPKVVEKNRTVPFDPKSKALWRIIANDLLEDLNQEGVSGDWDLEQHYSGGDEDPRSLALRGRVMAKVTALKMLGDHPDLLDVSADRFHDEDDKRGSKYIAELRERGAIVGPMLPNKFRETVGLLNDLMDDDRKVVLFSHFKEPLRWLHDAFPDISLVYHGEMSAKQKHAAKTEFTDDPTKRILLASDAGGTGLDLPVADVLINYNLPWSAGQLGQRNARIRRISSEFPSVLVINMLVRDSIDIRQHEMLKKKNEIADAITDGKMGDDHKVVMDLGTLKEFLEATLLEG